MKKEVIIEIATYMIIILFVYASLSKLLQFDIYVKDLHRSPFLKPYSTVLSIIVPAVELVISGLLFHPRTRLLGLYASTILMAVFTFYVWFIVAIVKDTPCSCGGLIRNLTWRQHLMFNIFYTVIAGIGTWLESRKNRFKGLASN